MASGGLAGAGLTSGTLMLASTVKIPALLPTYSNWLYFPLCPYQVVPVRCGRDPGEQLLTSVCVGLSGADKSQQMSDWTTRPLMPRQLQYAALDAFVQPQLYDVFVRELGGDRCQQLIKQHSFTFKKVSRVGQRIVRQLW